MSDKPKTTDTTNRKPDTWAQFPCEYCGHEMQDETAHEYGGCDPFFLCEKCHAKIQSEF
jgi:transcription elongation factor Elf1